MRMHAYRYLMQVLFLIGLFGCAGVPVSYYDSTTYTQLTSLKAETTTLVESFDVKPYADNQAKIEATMLSLRKAYEYEKGKGRPNSDTALQFTKISELFSGDVSDYKENAPEKSGKKFFQEASVLLGQAFDIAISTENLKNKDKR